jgi:chorismate synthase
LQVPNLDQRPHDYGEMDIYPRPSHADWTYLQKYGVKASSGGGRASARETIGRVAGGAIAQKYLKLANNVEIVAFVSSVGKVAMPFVNELEDGETVSPEFFTMLNTITQDEVDKDITRCPHPETAEMIKEVCNWMNLCMWYIFLRIVVLTMEINARSLWKRQRRRTPLVEPSLVLFETARLD